MATCSVCDGEMLKVSGCVKHIYLLNDETKITPIKAGEEGWVEEGEKCGDCGAKYGKYHHIGCDIERCGNCGGQYISCYCDYSDQIIIEKQV